MIKMKKTLAILFCFCASALLFAQEPSQNDALPYEEVEQAAPDAQAPAVSVEPPPPAPAAAGETEPRTITFTLPQWLPRVSLSAGGGALFNVHWNDARLREQFRDYTGMDFQPPHGVMGPTEATQDAMRQGLFDTRELATGWGLFGFFDATFVTASAAVIFNRVRHTVAIPYMPNIAPDLLGEEEHSFNFTQLNLAIFLRYPFEIAQGWTIFPLLGIDGQIALADFDDNMRRDFQYIANMGYDMPTVGEFWNSLWIRFGVGVDRQITESLFVRGEALYGFKLPSRYERRMRDFWQEELRGMSNGFHIRLALGYTFRRF